MPTYTSSANMALPVPIVGTTPGPDYASDINSCLTLIDQHDHSSGYGVAITPTGLNINAALPFGNNNLTGVRSLRFQTQGSPLVLAADLGCLYESGVDLYYNDGSGNQVRLTQSGSVAGTSGSIASLASPASATFVAGSGTFVWQSAANTPALMDSASVIIRNATAAANGVTIAAANALAANYTLTLPASLPAATNFLAVSSTGNISAYAPVSLGITAANIANATITTTQISGTAGILGSQISATAAIIGTQLNASANILGSQLSASAAIVGTQLTAGTITGTQVSSSAALSVASVATTGALTQNAKNAVVSNTNAASALGVVVGIFNLVGAFAPTAGTGYADGGGNGSTIRAITFSTAFASTPIVLAGNIGNAGLSYSNTWVYSISTTGATFRNDDGTNVQFIAIGPRA